jgi:uncharacterized protein YbbC (DUF1343 family)
VGRGTDRAFQWVGAPWLDGEALADAMSAYGFDGVRFEPASFTPREPGDGKFPDQEVHGVRLYAESSTYDAPRVAAAMLVESRALAGDDWAWREGHIDLLAGGDDLRHRIDAGQGVDEIVDAWAADRAAFEALRARYLIY